MTFTPSIRVAVFADSETRDTGRRVYWHDYIDRLGGAIDLVSVPERRSERPARRLPRLDGHAVIIVNWDAANGDYAFLADETLEYFQNRGRFELQRWAAGGARVIVEVQSAGGRPLQEVYDAIAGPREINVSMFDRLPAVDRASGRLWRNRWRSGHPIVRDLARDPDVIETKYRPQGREPFPRAFDMAQATTYAVNAGELAWGWFVEWSRGWIPLILSDHGYRQAKWRPVALGKAIGDGEIIVTTMRIASSMNEDLIDAFLDMSTVNRAAVQRFYRVAYRRSRHRRLIGLVAAWLVVLGIGIPLADYLTKGINRTATVWISDFAQNFAASSATHGFLRWFGDHFSISDTTAVAVILFSIRWTVRVWRMPYRL